MALSLTQGWTGPIQYRIINVDRKTGAKSNRDLTGSTVDIIIKDKQGSPVVTKSATIVDAEAGVVQVIPAVGELLVGYSPMQIKFKITDSLGRITFHPMGKHEVWEIFN